MSEPTTPPATSPATSPASSPAGPAAAQDANADHALSTLFRLGDLVTPHAIRVVATLRVADHIAAGITKARDLAARTRSDADALERVLRYLACRGVFRESAPGVFELTSVSRHLCSDRSREWYDLDLAGYRMDRAFAELMHTVRTGAPAYQYLHGADLFADLGEHPEHAASFDRLMANNAAWFAPHAAAVYDWSPVRHVVDVGGGTGGLLLELLAAYPHLHGTLVDQANAVGEARRRFAAAGFTSRCSVVAGSFFDELPAGGDVYVLAHILHDWRDEPSVRILRRCTRAAGPDGRVVVVERILADDEHRRPVTALDLRMMVYLGARERTLAEFNALAAEAGLTLRGTTPTPVAVHLLEYAPVP